MMARKTVALLAVAAFVPVLHAGTPAQRPGWLGFLVCELKPEEVRKWHVYPYSRPAIGAALPGDVAERAGLRAGDVLLTLNGQEVFTCEKLVELLDRTEAGTDVTLVTLREGKEERRVLRMAERPTPGALLAALEKMADDYPWAAYGISLLYYFGEFGIEKDDAASFRW